MKNLDSNKCIVHEDGCVYDFIAGIYKQIDEKSIYYDEYAITVNHG